MSGSMDMSVLFPTAGGTGQSSLLDALYGTGQSKKAYSATPLIALRNAEKNEAKLIATTAKDPAVARDVAAFRKAVAAAKTPADLLKDPRALKVLLTANGLAEFTDATALATRALLSNTKDKTSLVNRLTDTRWKPVAQIFDFATKGMAIIRDPKTLNTLVNAYAELSWRKSLESTTPGLSNALGFRSQAATVKSVLQILGDPVLRDVITTGLGIPKQIAFQNLTTQEKAISSRLDIAKLKDKHFVDTLTQQYLLNKADEARTADSQASFDQLASKAAGLVV